MADLTFSQQVMLQIIDKLGLGAVIGLGGLLASRIVERYKTGEAIRAEAAKVRIAKLADIWTELGKIRLRLSKLQSAAFAIEMGERLRAMSTNAAPTPHGEFPAEALAKIRTDLNSDLEALRTAVLSVQDIMNENTFWLGKRLQEDHLAHVEYLYGVIRALQTEWSTGKKNFKDIYVGNAMIGETIEDITTVAKEL